jgi:hypothetical protein
MELEKYTDEVRACDEKPPVLGGEILNITTRRTV